MDSAHGFIAMCGILFAGVGAEKEILRVGVLLSRARLWRLIPGCAVMLPLVGGRVKTRFARVKNENRLMPE